MKTKLKLEGLKILHHLGEGAMGEVYLAIQKDTGRFVAVKVLSPDLNDDPDFVRRFKNEVKTLAKIDHPNVVRALNAGSNDDDRHYLTMSYIDGEMLEDILEREGPMKEKKALKLILKVAKALKFIWENHRLIHRDIKPGNIMIDNHGNPKILDFGLSKSPKQQPRATLSGYAIGTPKYMSPEQVTDKELDYHADIYSLGVTLYEMLTGMVPFSGETTEIMLKVLENPIPIDPMKEKNISIPCKQLLQSMLEKEQKYRPSWDELILDIKSIIKKKRLSRHSRFRNYRRRILSMINRKKYLNYTHEMIAVSRQTPEKIPADLQVRIKKLRYARIFLWSSIIFAVVTIILLLLMIGQSQ